MRRFILFLCFSLLVSPVFAHFDNWVYPGDTFTMNDQLYTVKGGPYTILVSTAGEEHVIDYGDCAASGMLEYCFVESDYVACQKGDYTCPEKDGEPDDWCCPYDVAHVRFDAGDAVWGVHLVVREVKPELTVTRTPEKSVLDLDEVTKITLLFENTGDKFVKDAQYVEHVPEGFSVVSMNGLTMTGEGLTATFSLSPGKTRRFSYEVKPTAYVSGSFTGTLTYTYLGKEQEVKPKSFTINVPSPFLITHEFTPAVLGKNVVYQYTLKNTAGAPMRANVTITGLAPSQLPKGVSEEDGALVWRGELEDGEEATLEFPFIPRKTGTLLVGEETEMEAHGKHFSHESQDTLLIDVKKPVPKIQFSTAEPTAGQNVTVRVLLDNKEGDTDFVNLRGRLTSSLGTKEYALDALPAGAAPLLGEQVLTLPEGGSYTFTFSGTYDTLYGESFSFSTSATLVVPQRSTPFRIIQDVNASTAAPGDSLEVRVRVKNQQQRYATVTVSDQVPTGSLVTSGLREKEMSLKGGEEREAYVYRVTIPESYDTDVFPITTSVVEQAGVTQPTSVTQQFNVTIERPNQEEAPSKQNNTVEAPREQAVVEQQKKGFFQRLITGLTHFFTALFS